MLCGMCEIHQWEDEVADDDVLTDLCSQGIQYITAHSVQLVFGDLTFHEISEWIIVLEFVIHGCAQLWQYQSRAMMIERMILAEQFFRVTGIDLPLHSGLDASD